MKASDSDRKQLKGSMIEDERAIIIFEVNVDLVMSFQFKSLEFKLVGRSCHITVGCLVAKCMLF